MNRAGLLKAMKAVMPGVAKGEAIIPGADSFVFKGDIIQSYNDHLSITYPFDSGIHGSVKAIEMYKILEKMSGNEVIMERAENSIKITDGKTNLSMRIIEIETENLIQALALEELGWKQLPENFPLAMRLCLQSVSRNVTLGPMVGIRIEGDEAISSDNFRATIFKLSEPMDSFTIPGTAVSDLLKLENLEQYAVTESWAHFMNQEGAIFSSRLIWTEYPYESLRNMFPEVEEDEYHLPKGLEKVLGRVGVVTYLQDDGLDYLVLKEKDGFLLVKGERQFANCDEKIELQENEWPDGVEINIQPGYLMDILSMTRNFQMIEKLAYFHGEGFKHIISTVVRD